MSTTGFFAFLARKKIKPSAKLYFVDAMSAMAMGLFASLLIGTILDTLGDLLHWEWLITAAGYAGSATGIAIAVAIGVSLSAPPLVLYSLCAVGLGSYSVGGPLGAFFAVIVAAELGKAVSRETKIDILVTPTVTILSGLGVGSLIGPGVSLLMNGFGQLIIRATQLRPFLMGIIVSVLVGIVLTLPISSAAICFTLTLTGLAGGAATAGCCAQMIGFAVMSFAENGWGGLVAQVLAHPCCKWAISLKIPASGCLPPLQPPLQAPSPPAYSVWKTALPLPAAWVPADWSAPSASSAGMASAARSTGWGLSSSASCCPLFSPRSSRCPCAVWGGSKPATANWIFNLIKKVPFHGYFSFFAFTSFAQCRLETYCPTAHCSPLQYRYTPSQSLPCTMDHRYPSADG